ncbi:TPA: hypothetical protein R4S64_001934 [Kluyvera georgiana]|uniref:hypothetical protein n=1 Tax=Kluyvera georgiana TaxID=73098 RepID=UPI0013DACF88|nr:hypothetical protein [Kluyvera georgiana]MDA8494164.1 hypothetical protein [Kluyvera georgiana]HDG1691027.1 hypothetical protein [Kluyvera georgiana]HED1419952.1 hypothetical protein [Kluyvera georgiana]
MGKIATLRQNIVLIICKNYVFYYTGIYRIKYSMHRQKRNSFRASRPLSRRLAKDGWQSASLWDDLLRNTGDAFD